MSEPALLACPFCGGQMMFRQALWPSEGDTDSVIHADANPLNCPLPDFSNDTADLSVIEAWNTRDGYLGDNGPYSEPALNIAYRNGRLAALTSISGDPGEITDGYHTFSELYEHRHALFIALCRNILGRGGNSTWPWRSKLHADGTMFDGWFVMGFNNDARQQITYHLPLRLWGVCGFATELDRAPEWDGHTPADVIERLRSL